MLSGPFFCPEVGVRARWTIPTFQKLTGYIDSIWPALEVQQDIQSLFATDSQVPGQQAETDSPVWSDRWTSTVKLPDSQAGHPGIQDDVTDTPDSQVSRQPAERPEPGVV